MSINQSVEDLEEFIRGIHYIVENMQQYEEESPELVHFFCGLLMTVADKAEFVKNHLKSDTKIYTV